MAKTKSLNEVMTELQAAIGTGFDDKGELAKVLAADFEDDDFKFTETDSTKWQKKYNQSAEYRPNEAKLYLDIAEKMLARHRRQMQTSVMLREKYEDFYRNHMMPTLKLLRKLSEWITVVKGYPRSPKVDAKIGDLVAEYKKQAENVLRVSRLHGYRRIFDESKLSKLRDMAAKDSISGHQLSPQVLQAFVANPSVDLGATRMSKISKTLVDDLKELNKGENITLESGLYKALQKTVGGKRRSKSLESSVESLYASMPNTKMETVVPQSFSQQMGGKRRSKRRSKHVISGGKRRRSRKRRSHNNIAHIVDGGRKRRSSRSSRSRRSRRSKHSKQSVDGGKKRSRRSRKH